MSSHVTPDREHLTELADEQAALRRIATLVAGGAPAPQIFAAVAEEVGPLLGAELGAIQRYEPGGYVTLVGSWGDLHDALPVGSRRKIEGDNLGTLVYRTARSARFDDYEKATGPIAADARKAEVRSAVAGPIVVNGRLWGLIAAATSRAEPLRADVESRIAEFAELVAAAISNVQARAEAQRLADEQAALRRVATLVARGVGPEEVFSAVSDEIDGLFGSDQAGVARFEPDESGFVIVGVSEGTTAVPAGSRWELDASMALDILYRTGRPARNGPGAFENPAGPLTDRLADAGIVSAVSAPILVEGRVWGFLAVGGVHKPLPADSEARLENFAELVGTAIANAESRAELATSEARALSLATEQAALRRVATLIAEAAKDDEVFSAVGQEVGQVFGVELVTVCRYEPDAMIVLSSAGIPAFPAGSRWSLDVPSLPGSVHRTGGAVRIDDFTEAAGLDAIARDAGVKSAVGVPIVVDGTVWGSINAASTDDEPFPADAEERLARFTDLVATLISNATMRAELAASRARIAAAADEERRRVVRDLHDGAQQRLVHTIVTLNLAQRAQDNEDDEKAWALIREARQHAQRAKAELRDLSHGILPSILTHGGLVAAVTALGSRTSIPIEIDIAVDRVPAAVEATAYFIVAEALTNVAKHSHAQRAEVTARLGNGTLEVRIRDDGIGGARPDGSGLVGLRDRVEALAGTITIDSPDGRGTTVVAKLPLHDTPAAGPDQARV